jgi:arginyl-tRNA synthetase
MDILAASVWLRYLEECGEVLTFPSNGYRGDYVREIAANLHRESNNEYRHPVALVFEEIPADEPQGGDKDIHIDEYSRSTSKPTAANKSATAEP